MTVQISSYLQGPLGEAVLATDATATLGTPTLRPALLLEGSTAGGSTVEGPHLRMLGPGDVVGLASGAVVRTDPLDGAVDVEPNYLAVVELVPPELPWLLTPARPADGRLRPWLVLVVVETATAGFVPGDPPVLRADVAELPDLRESWAWAHVQRSSGAVLPGGGTAPVGSVGRLVCARRLRPGVRYRACLVPAFSTGVAAGLGDPPPPGTPHAPAWDVGVGGAATLPVLHTWTFTTGPSGDFEQLVRRLHPADPVAFAASSARVVDARAPWPGTPASPEPLLVGVRGALVPVGATDEPEPRLGADDEARFRERITTHVEAPAARVRPEGDGDADRVGALAPPLYGGPHVGAQLLAEGPAWLAQLNTSIPYRIAAGLGAEYVRTHQERLMARAWEQVGAIREANRRRGVVELTTVVAERVHARHVAPLEPGELIALAAPANARTTTSPSTTLALEERMSRLVDGAATTAFARRVRPHGGLGRRTGASVRGVVPRALEGVVTVPVPAPVVPPSPSSGASVAPEVVAEATARQLVALTALGSVAAVNGDAVGSAALAARVEQVTGPAMASALAAGTVADVVGAISADVVAASAAAQAAVSDLVEHPEQFGSAGLLGVPVEGARLAARVSESLLPGSSHRSRLASQTTVPPGLAASGADAPLMASPEFPLPTALTLLESDPEWLVPGVGAFPANAVALLRPHGAFVESFLVGMNSELMRELVWREFPTDRRGTAFSRFWPRPSGTPDVPPVATWTDDVPLGTRAAGSGDLAVLLVRGDVLRRYPGTLVTAIRSAPPDAEGRLLPDPAGVPQVPLFALPVDEGTTAFAFEIPTAELVRAPTADAPGWFFVFAENAYRIRFGFDEPGPTPGTLTGWADAEWPPPDGPRATSVPVVRGHASVGTPFGPPTGDGAAVPADVPVWGRDAADTARITLQRPFRVAVQAAALLVPPGADAGGGG
ncbi:hypothetical protein Q9R32_16680 [Actinotalea sp. AC32]|nr:hypothetical protein [Actinotalea sp. AC32]